MQKSNLSPPPSRLIFLLTRLYFKLLDETKAIIRDKSIVINDLNTKQEGFFQRRKLSVQSQKVIKRRETKILMVLEQNNIRNKL